MFQYLPQRYLEWFDTFLAQAEKIVPQDLCPETPVPWLRPVAGDFSALI
jgi:hypothetical protein